MEKRLIDANKTIKDGIDKGFCDWYDEIKYAETVLTIPDNPTNGDMIKALFPGAKIDANVYTYVIEVKLPYHTKHDTGLLFDKDWWNAPYTGLNKPDPDVGRMM